MHRFALPAALFLLLGAATAQQPRTWLPNSLWPDQLPVGRDPASDPRASRPKEHTTNATATSLLEKLPVAFIENQGQWDEPAKFIARGEGMTLRAEKDGLVLQCAHTRDGSTKGVVVRLLFEGARANATIAGEQQQPGTYNFLVGDDRTQWRTGVKGYASILYQDLYEGIDLRVRSEGRRLEYDLILAPGADLDRMVVRCEGTLGIEIQPDGSLAMATTLGPIRQSAPITWQVLANGERKPIEANFRKLGSDRYGFEAPGRDASLALVIDPGLTYSTLLGGSGLDFALGVAVGASGAATVVGYTDSTNFPTTAGAFDTSHNGNADVFVVRLAPSGASLEYATFLGDIGDDRAYGVALDAAGAATITGYTTSTGFPTTAGAFDTSYNGGTDAFIARLAPSGGSLVYSTFLGATGPEKAESLALEPSGAATIVGWTQSATFPVTPLAFDRTYNGGSDAFVARLAPSGGSLVYATYLGGIGHELAHAVAVDAAGAAIIVGETNSGDFPGQSGPGLSIDAFVVRLSSSGGNLVRTTLLGGAGVDVAYGVALDTSGEAIVVGTAQSTDFPVTPGAFDTSHNGSFDAFVTKLSPSLGSLFYSTFLGASGDEKAAGVAVDTSGAATVVGQTGFGGAGFPTTAGAFDTTNNGVPDTFVTRLTPSGTSLLYSTFLGVGEANAVALDVAGAATVTGSTNASTFPTTPGAFDTSLNGSFDSFISRLDMLPRGASAFGSSTAGCQGPLAIGVTSIPQIGNASFSITCTNAPASTTGILAIAGGGLSSPIPILGAQLWLDPGSAFFLTISAGSNARGAATFSLPLPPNPSLVGQRIHTQFFWGSPTSPPPCPPAGLSASNALAIVIQP